MLNLKTLSYTTACSVLILSSLNTPTFAAPGDTFTFTNCSATGPVGPTQGACDTAYTATSLNGLVTVVGGIQSWVVPETATYTIQALGAAGGTNTATAATAPVIGGPFPGGLGASIQGEVNLTAGETIFFVVGQMGEDTRVNTEDQAAPGGGGGSFVYRLATDPTPLIAAGGGAGAVACSPTSGNPDANITTDGNSAFGLNNGGTAGNGGTTNTGGSSYWAGGGAGWLTDGTGGDNPTDYDFTGAYAEGGRSPQNGALGGTRHIDGGGDEGGDGGFGGGGGGGSDNMGTGGGGGFSGGGGANGDNDAGCGEASVGGGGGSFNSGANPVNTAAANAGQGQIVVTQLGAGTQAIPTTSFWGLALLTSLLGLFGLSRRRMK